MKALYWICLVLLFIGGLNRGLVGVFDFDLVAFLLGDMSVASRVVYTVVAIAGIVTLAMNFTNCELKE